MHIERTCTLKAHDAAVEGEDAMEAALRRNMAVRGRGLKNLIKLSTRGESYNYKKKGVGKLGQAGSAGTSQGGGGVVGGGL